MPSFNWKDFFAMVLPNLSKDAQWRLFVLAMLAFFGFHIMWACGRIPGLEGFASAQALVTQASTLQTLEQQQNTILVRMIITDIESSRESQCKAVNAKNGAASDAWRARLEVALSEYRTTTRQDYRLRNCSEY